MAQWVTYSPNVDKKPESVSVCGRVLVASKLREQDLYSTVGGDRTDVSLSPQRLGKYSSHKSFSANVSSIQNSSQC